MQLSGESLKLESDIILHKKDDVFFQVECERSIARELNDFFSFDVPEAKFMPAYKNRVWDGKIRLFDTRNNQIYGGLYSYIRDFAEKRSYSITVVIIHHFQFTEKMSNLLSQPWDYLMKLEITKWMPCIIVYDLAAASLLVLLHLVSHSSYTF